MLSPCVFLFCVSCCMLSPVYSCPVSHVVCGHWLPFLYLLDIWSQLVASVICIRMMSPNIVSKNRTTSRQPAPNPALPESRTSRSLCRTAVKYYYIISVAFSCPKWCWKMWYSPNTDWAVPDHRDEPCLQWWSAQHTRARPTANSQMYIGRCILPAWINLIYLQTTRFWMVQLTTTSVLPSDLRDLPTVICVCYMHTVDGQCHHCPWYTIVNALVNWTGFVEKQATWYFSTLNIIRDSLKLTWMVKHQQKQIIEEISPSLVKSSNHIFQSMESCQWIEQWCALIESELELLRFWRKDLVLFLKAIRS